jgi:hypothetical protein
MVQVGQVSETVTPWMWGINGAAGVVGTVLAVFLSMMWGISMTMLVGVACYGFVLAANVALLRTRATAKREAKMLLVPTEKGLAGS